MNLKSAVNPTWFQQDESAPSSRCPPRPGPSTRPAARRSPTGPPSGGRQEDLRLPRRAVQVGVHLGDQPAVAGGRRTVQLTAFSAATGGFTMAPNRPTAARTPRRVQLPDRAVHVRPGRVQRGQVGQRRPGLRAAPRRAAGAVPDLHLQRFGYSGWGWSYVAYNFKDTTGNFNNIIDKLYIRQALAHLENEPGYIHAFMNGAAGQAFGPIPQPAEPVHPV